MKNIPIDWPQEKWNKNKELAQELYETRKDELWAYTKLKIERVLGLAEEPKRTDYWRKWPLRDDIDFSKLPW